MIDATHIAGTIYQGGAPPLGAELACAGFRVLVLCAREIQPSADLFSDLVIVHAPTDDADRPPLPVEYTNARQAAIVVALAAMRGVPVLVTCAQGRNRSGLVTALALHRLTGEGGAACARHVRRCRAGALTNPHFLALLRGIPQRASS